MGDKNIRFCSISSGSKGNCYLLQTDGSVLLIDAGISGKKIFQGLESCGLKPEDVDGVLVTHEHSDHIKGVRMVCKKSPKARVYATHETWKQFAPEDYLDRHMPIAPQKTFFVNDVEILPVDIHHDAVQPVGYIIKYAGKKIAIVTDTGHICSNIYEQLIDAELIVLEANHEVNVLKVCSYPYRTKMRILSDYGHLSNVAAATCIADLMKESFEKRRIVLLAHLSKENNTPQMAQLAVTNELHERGLLSMEKICLDTLLQDTISDVYEI